MHIQRFGFPRAIILPNYMKQNISWKTESRATTPNSSNFIKRNSSLPSPQKPAAILYLHPQLPEDLYKCHPSIYAYVSQVVSFHIYQLKIWTLIFLSPMRVICLAQIVIPDLWHTQNKPLCSTTCHFPLPPINFPSLWPTHYSQHPVLRYPQIYALRWLFEIKFETHSKQHVTLRFSIFNINSATCS